MVVSIDETHASVRFKHGIHTIYLFVDIMGPMAEVGKELRSLLRERYPEGLTTSLDPSKTTPIPDEDSNLKMAYAVLNVPNDPTRGWRQLRFDDDVTTDAGTAGLRQNGIVAFTFVDGSDDEPVFEVEWPAEDEDMYEAEQ